MGRSAKLHKRKHKSSNAASQPQSQSQPQPQHMSLSQPVNRKVTSTSTGNKKRKDLKFKTARQISVGAKEALLGGADYVTLMLGGRRKAKEEAKKLPLPEGALSSLSL